MLSISWYSVLCIFIISSILLYKVTNIYIKKNLNCLYCKYFILPNVLWHKLQTTEVCLFSPFREEALSDAQWWHPTGVPPPPAQYQSSAEGCYQHRDAPPTTRDPLITSCTTWPGMTARRTSTAQTLSKTAHKFIFTNCHKAVRI